MSLAIPFFPMYVVMFYKYYVVSLVKEKYCTMTDKPCFFDMLWF